VGELPSPEEGIERMPFLRSNRLFFLAAFALSALAGCALLSPSSSHPPISEAPAPEPAKPESPSIAPSRFTIVAIQSGDTFASLAQKYLHDPSMDWLIADLNGISSLTAGETIVIPLVPYQRGGLSTHGYKTVPILSYHKFTRSRPDLVSVTEKAFEEQMRYLKDNGYHVITLDELFDFIDFKRDIPGRSVVITMDDGWRSAYDIGYPILKKYGFPSTMFIYTNFVGSGQAVSWNMLREMARNGVDIECHTVTHRYLDRRIGNESFHEYFEAIKKELTESSRIIKQHVGTDVKYVAYPYGNTNHLVIALLAKLGYRGAFTVARDSNPFFVNPYRVSRSMIYGTFDMDDFKSNLKTLATEAVRQP